MFVVPGDGGIFLFLSLIPLFLFRRFFETEFILVFTLMIMVSLALAPAELADEITQTNDAFLRHNDLDDSLRRAISVHVLYAPNIALAVTATQDVNSVK